MGSIQHQLSDYLQSELWHSLGAYRVAEEQVRELAKELRADHERIEQTASETRDTSVKPIPLHELAQTVSDHNRELRRYRHASPPRRREEDMQTEGSPPDGWPYRDPLPSEEVPLPLSNGQRFRVGEPDRPGRDHVRPWNFADELYWIPRFYSEAIYALDNYDKNTEPADDTPEWLEYTFAESLIAPRDGATGAYDDTEWRPRKTKRIERYRHRREQVHVLLRQDHHESGEHGGGIRGRAARKLGHALGQDVTRDPLSLDDQYEHDAAFLKRIGTENLASGRRSLPFFVIKVQAEAHLSMHAVEAWQSMCLGEHAQALGEDERRWLNTELDRSIALSTFAYCVSRTAPWIFAENDSEREGVFRAFSSAWENMVPARCMWIAGQVSLLALHRRAYAHNMRERPDRAYNDYHKLQRLIRDTERRVRAAPIHVEGALEFLAGLDAEASHHIGELYRSEHAYKPALEHFEAASHRLERLRREGKVDDVITNSRWYVQLQISRGKASYEMGRQKEALYWYMHAWRAFLELLAAETETETNTKAIEDAIDWLERVKFEPELRKSEVSRQLLPVVDQLDRITVIPGVRVLAAEILLRLGHLLLVLNVGFDGRDPAAADPKDAREHVRHTLAYVCLRKAAECDSYCTLVATDLLKARFRFNDWLDRRLPDEYGEQLEFPPLVPIDEHWPRGSNDYERLARVAEYLTLRARIDHFERSPDLSEMDSVVARDLLLSLFMNTDSINVRKAQIHRFLMKPEWDGPVPHDHGAPAIELICMRRYSSPFPLLPRPSAFRALGGGYFLRLHSAFAQERGEESSPEGARARSPFGIVVDPGVDFVENLYRTGYSLSDVDMVVVTHDHVDHLGAVDPLLSLLHVRCELLSKQAKSGEAPPAPQTVKILVSRSVYERYESVRRLVGSRPDDEQADDKPFEDAPVPDEQPDGERSRKDASSSNGRRSNEFEFKCFEGLIGEGGVIEQTDDFFADFPKGFEIVAMSSAAGIQTDPRGHLDLSMRPSHGLCFRGVDGGPSIAITSDIPRPPAENDREEWHRTWAPALAADILVVHLGSVPLTELRRLDQVGGSPREGAADGGGVSNGEQAQLADDEAALKEIRAKLQAADDRLQGQVEYAQWLRSHAEKKGVDAPTAELVGAVPDTWLPPPDHSYVEGLLTWAREFLCVNEDRARLFVVGELSEELGSMRGKVASRLNERVFDDGPSCALTADIGLHVCTARASGDAEGEGCVKVLCTTCNLDTDRVPDERYHTADDVFEVCVKGENEGIFYNCREHDPACQHDPTFLEQLERFDIFGR